ncbi:MAG: AzlD domain-containing protein [bacterium]|nr:AzlD domain-containing protein [bacterium]
MSTIHSILLIAVISLVTALIRFLPFLIFRDKDHMPEALQYLGGILPAAIMGMLVVYCFKSTVVTAWPFGLPEVIATILVVASYLWKKNILLSVAAGTVFYMILVQGVFA